VARLSSAFFGQTDVECEILPETRRQTYYLLATSDDNELSVHLIIGTSADLAAWSSNTNSSLVGIK
jgi:hypothetical protein